MVAESFGANSLMKFIVSSNWQGWSVYMLEGSIVSHIFMAAQGKVMSLRFGWSALRLGSKHLRACHAYRNRDRCCERGGSSRMCR